MASLLGRFSVPNSGNHRSPRVEVLQFEEGFMKKDLSRRQVRWAQDLSAYWFTIAYREGKGNPADGPSRRPDYEKSFQGESEVDELGIAPALKAFSGSHGKRVAPAVGCHCQFGPEGSEQNATSVASVSDWVDAAPSWGRRRDPSVVSSSREALGAFGEVAQGQSTHLGWNTQPRGILGRFAVPNFWVVIPFFMELRAPRFGDPISCFASSTSGFSLGDVILLIMVERLKTMCIYTFLMLLLIVVEHLKTICIYTFMMLLLLIANLIIRSRLSLQLFLSWLICRSPLAI